MALLLWDASALAMRFVAETWSPTVNTLFSAIPRDQIVTTIVGYSETFAAVSPSLGPRVAAVAQLTPWRWRLHDRTYLVGAVRFRLAPT